MRGFFDPSQQEISKRMKINTAVVSHPAVDNDEEGENMSDGDSPQT